MKDMTKVARSFCKCGHKGDGSHSDHSNTYPVQQDGHGRCMVVGCNCSQFIWERFTDEMAEYYRVGSSKSGWNKNA